MPNRLRSILPACLTVAAITGVYAQRGQPPRPDNPASLSHLKTAQSLAGNDAFLAIPHNFFCVAGNARAQNNNAPDVEPTRLFDNVYAVGNSETTVYALTSSEGILLFDAGFEAKAEALAAQLKALNLDPARVKYIFVGHGHGDHFGGARFFQTTYGTKIAASAADCKAAKLCSSPKPRADSSANIPRAKISKHARRSPAPTSQYRPSPNSPTSVVPTARFPQP